MALYGGNNEMKYWKVSCCFATVFIVDAVLKVTDFNLFVIKNLLFAYLIELAINSTTLDS